MDFFSTLQWWHWLVLGMGLLILEVLAPAEFFIWIGIAAMLLAAITGIFGDMGWQLQIILFGILSIVSLIAGRIWFKRHGSVSDEPNLNRRGNQYVGQTFTLVDAIENGAGSVKVGDSRWRVSGVDMPAGSRVRVTAVSGSTLQVEAG